LNLLYAQVSKLFLIDKPAGLSSFSALKQLKKSLGTGKVGHAGTLDPFATGLLLALSGKLTRLSGPLSRMDKRYEALLRFGEETDTLDSEGSLRYSAPIPQIDDIIQASKAFSGDILQVPPAYSAIKIGGKRAYAEARRGKTVDIPARRVHINSFEIIDWNAPELRVRVQCSSGTYIRAIARDLGIATGSRAFCSGLRRTAIGNFDVDDATAPADQNSSSGVEAVEFLERLGAVVRVIDEETAEGLHRGLNPERMGLLAGPEAPLILYVDFNNKPVALLESRESRLSYKVVFD